MPQPPAVRVAGSALPARVPPCQSCCCGIITLLHLLLQALPQLLLLRDGGGGALATTVATTTVHGSALRAAAAPTRNTRATPTPSIIQQQQRQRSSMRPRPSTQGSHFRALSAAVGSALPCPGLAPCRRDARGRTRSQTVLHATDALPPLPLIRVHRNPHTRTPHTHTHAPAARRLAGSVRGGRRQHASTASDTLAHHHAGGSVGDECVSARRRAGAWRHTGAECDRPTEILATLLYHHLGASAPPRAGINHIPAPPDNTYRYVTTWFCAQAPVAAAGRGAPHHTSTRPLATPAVVAGATHGGRRAPPSPISTTLPTPDLLDSHALTHRRALPGLRAVARHHLVLPSPPAPASDPRLPHRCSRGQQGQRAGGGRRRGWGQQSVRAAPACR